MVSVLMMLPMSLFRWLDKESRLLFLNLGKLTTEVPKSRWSHLRLSILLLGMICGHCRTAALWDPPKALMLLGRGLLPFTLPHVFAKHVGKP